MIKDTTSLALVQKWDSLGPLRPSITTWRNLCMVSFLYALRITISFYDDLLSAEGRRAPSLYNRKSSLTLGLQSARASQGLIGVFPTQCLHFPYDASFYCSLDDSLPSPETAGSSNKTTIISRATSNRGFGGLRASLPAASATIRRSRSSK